MDRYHTEDEPFAMPDDTPTVTITYARGMRLGPVSHIYALRDGCVVHAVLDITGTIHGWLYLDHDLSQDVITAVRPALQRAAELQEAAGDLV